MPQIIQILGMPFLACVLIGSILGYLGTHVLKREVIFIDIALAQIAAVGSIIAHLVFEAHDDSMLAYICSFSCVLLASAFFAFVRSKIFQISLEAVIGISYALSAAAALFLVGIAPGGHVHVQQILSGSLLWTSWRDIILCLVVFSAVGFCFLIFRKTLTAISDKYLQTSTLSFRAALWDFIFYMLLGFVVTLAVQIAGVVVVFGYLIIPATIAAIFSSRIRVHFFVIWTTTIAGSITGLLFAYYLDFSIGPSIALFLGGELIIAAIISKVFSGLAHC